jgi:hypothetical protein
MLQIVSYTPEAMAAWHQANRDRRMPLIRDRKRKHKSEMLAWIRELKEGSPCVDCHRHYPYYVMQYDHISDNKEVNIANVASRAWSKERIRSEIDKCDLVCANCHAERTHQRRLSTDRSDQLP